MSSEQIQKRRANCNRILRALHFEGPMTRGALSRLCGIRKSSTTTIVNELTAAGLVRLERPGYYRSPVRLASDARHAVVASVTPGRLRFARVYLDGTLRTTHSRRMSRSPAPEDAIRLLAEGLATLLDAREGIPVGVGVVLPGPVDPARGTVLSLVNLGAWRDVELGAALGRALGTPVRVDNDVRSQLWSCAWFDRLLEQADSILYIGLLQGVACAMILHGRRVMGGRLLAGEIGHVRAGAEGRLCNCGKRDCLETYCGFPWLVRDVGAAAGAAPRRATQAWMAGAARADPRVNRVLEAAMQRLAHYVAGLVIAMDPQVVVIGAEARAFAELMGRHLQRHLYKELLGLDVSDTELRVAESADALTLKGIGALVIEQAFATGTFSCSAR